MSYFEIYCFTRSKTFAKVHFPQLSRIKNKGTMHFKLHMQELKLNIKLENTVFLVEILSLNGEVIQFLIYYPRKITFKKFHHE